MAKSKRTRRAKNKIEGALQGALVEADPLPQAAIVLQRPDAVRLLRKSIFSAEFEEVIEIIARERVYRAMRRDLELRRQLLASTPGKTQDGPSH